MANPEHLTILKQGVEGWPFRLRCGGLAMLICLSSLSLVAQSTASKGPALPKELHSLVAKDLALQDDDPCLTEQKSRLEDQITTEWVQLGRKIRGILIMGIGPCNAGPNSGPILMYAQVDGSWKKVLDENGNRLLRLKSTTSGWKDLELWHHDSVFTSVRDLLHFNGKNYVTVQCNLVRYGDIGTGETFAKPMCEPCP